MCHSELQKLAGQRRCDLWKLAMLKRSELQELAEWRCYGLRKLAVHKCFGLQKLTELKTSRLYLHTWWKRDIPGYRKSSCERRRLQKLTIWEWFKVVFYKPNEKRTLRVVEARHLKDVELQKLTMWEWSEVAFYEANGKWTLHTAEAHWMKTLSLKIAITREDNTFKTSLCNYWQR